jgi:hypothetical protein
MVQRKRWWVWLLLALTIVTVVLLSASLSQLQFHSGEPFALEEETPGAAGAGGGLLVGERLFWLIFQALLLCTLPILVALLLVTIFVPEARRRLFRYMLIFLALLAVLFLLYRPAVELPPEEEQLPDAGTGGMLPTPAYPVSEFEQTSAPWLVTIVAVILALLFAAGLVGAAWLVWRRRQRPIPSLAQLARPAQEALRTLEAGGDLRNTVLRCYYEMSRILGEQRGIWREEAMTPREFERRLVAAGLPSEHVHRLTRLFEDARYSTRAPGEYEEQEAIGCLRVIVEAIGNLS